jgi:hypothetical protein
MRSSRHRRIGSSRSLGMKTGLPRCSSRIVGERIQIKEGTCPPDGYFICGSIVIETLNGDDQSSELQNFSPLDRNPLHFIERHLVTPVVVQLCGSRAGMIGHSRSLFECAAVSQIRSDAGRTETVIADACVDLGRSGAAPDHGVGIGLGQRGLRQRSPVPRPMVRNSAYLIFDRIESADPCQRFCRGW